MITRLFFLVLVVPFLGGCPNPNTYTSARTLRAGDGQLLVAAEGYGGVSEDLDGNAETEASPLLPTIGARYAVSDSAEIGLRAPNLMSLAADTKVQLLRGTLDIALDPGVQWFSAEGSWGDEAFAVHIFDLHAPILFGWNLGPKASLVAAPGITFRSLVGDSEEGVTHQWFGQAAFGVNLRVSKRLAIQPQVSLMWDLAEMTEQKGIAMIAGLGFSFGGQPSFEDLDGQTTEVPVVARQ